MSKRTDTAANAVKNGYEATVKVRALMRAGGNQHLNGHIFEIMASYGSSGCSET